MKPETESKTAPFAVIGIDIGKEVFHLVGLGVDGKTAFRRRIKRLGLKDAFEKLPPCIVGLEACLSAHFVSKGRPARAPQLTVRDTGKPKAAAQSVITRKRWSSSVTIWFTRSISQARYS